MKINIVNRIGSYTVRNKQFEGRNHLVVPVTILVEGVHSGSGGPVYYSNSLLADSYDLWNGMPVLIQHSESNGEPVSCTNPQVFNEQKVGTLFNVRYVSRKLKGELWLDENRLRQLDSSLLEKIKNGQNIEVSTGLVSLELGDSGVWNTEQFDREMIEYTADHLAILPDSKGACSINDGCGIGNKEGGNNSVVKDVLDKMKEWKKRLIENEDEGFIDNEDNFMEVQRKLQTYLNTLDNDRSIYYLKAVYNEYMVYEVIPGPNAIPGTNSMLLKADYVINADDSVNLEEPVEVKKEISFVEINNEAINNDDCNCNKEEDNGGNVNMDKEKIVNELIACECSKWKEDNREALMALDEGILANMSFVPKEVTKPEKVEPKEEPTPEPVKVENKEDDKVDPNAWLEAAPPEVKAVVEDAIRVANEKKAELIEKILAVEGVTFNKESLADKSVNDLKDISSLIVVNEKKEDAPVNFFGGAVGVIGNVTKDAPLSPVNVFAKEVK